MRIRIQKFVENSIEAYWRLSDELGNTAWGEFLTNWVISCRHGLDMLPTSPIISPEGGFVIIPKREDFKARAYDERLEILSAHKIYISPETAEEIIQLKPTFHEDCFDLSIKITQLQNDLIGIIEKRIAAQLKFPFYGNSANSYLSFWVKNNIIFPSRVNDWPATETLAAIPNTIHASLAELAYYERELDTESICLPDTFWSEYSGALDIVDNLADWLITVHQTSLKTEEMPEQLKKMIERDKAILKTEFSRDGTRGL